MRVVERFANKVGCRNNQPHVVKEHFARVQILETHVNPVFYYRVYGCDLHISLKQNIVFHFYDAINGYVAHVAVADIVISWSITQPASAWVEVNTDLIQRGFSTQSK